MTPFYDAVRPILDQRRAPGVLPVLLHLLSWGYGAATTGRALAYRRGWRRTHRLPCKVVSVGNLTAGGTGKTPMVMYLAEMLQQAGMRPAILSRGYRGRMEQTGGLVSDGNGVSCAPEMAGDEPTLMARRLPGVPVAVGRDRVRIGTMLAERCRPDVILVDDGFQHLRLHRDLDLVLLDGAHPFGNSHVLPRGLLREPILALGRADALVMTRSGPADGALPSMARGTPVFRAVHEPFLAGCVPSGAAALAPSAHCRTDGCAGKRVAAFAGIAQPKRLAVSIREMGAEMAALTPFPDHHDYRPADIRKIMETARDSGADLLVTTEKDWVRLASLAVRWPMDLVVMGVKISFGPDAGRFLDFIKQGLR